MDQPFPSLCEALFVVCSEEVRIDKLLTQRYPHYSRTYFQDLIQQGFVLVNGLQVKKQLIPEEGDEIEVCFQLTPELSLEAEPISLDILYEDEFFLAINKPAGMVVHPAPGHSSGTFVNALLHHCKELPTSESLRPGIVHRLDKETSGILLAAKTSIAHQKLIEKFATRQVEKKYLAICAGRPRNGIFSAPIGRHPVHRKEMAVLPDGKEAISEVQVLALQDPLSLVLIKPKTGRTHQIRVHLKHLGAPVLGDVVYGQSRANQLFDAQRQMLHAYRLSFSHPIHDTPVELMAPFPQDFQAWIEKFAFSSSL